MTIASPDCWSPSQASFRGAAGSEPLQTPSSTPIVTDIRASTSCYCHSSLFDQKTKLVTNPNDLSKKNDHLEASPVHQITESIVDLSLQDRVRKSEEPTWSLFRTPPTLVQSTTSLQEMRNLKHDCENTVISSTEASVDSQVASLSRRTTTLHQPTTGGDMEAAKGWDCSSADHSQLIQNAPKIPESPDLSVGFPAGPANGRRRRLLVPCFSPAVLAATTTSGTPTSSTVIATNVVLQDVVACSRMIAAGKIGDATTPNSMLSTSSTNPVGTINIVGSVPDPLLIPEQLPPSSTSLLLSTKEKPQHPTTTLLLRQPKGRRRRGGSNHGMSGSLWMDNEDDHGHIHSEESCMLLLPPPPQPARLGHVMFATGTCLGSPPATPRTPSSATTTAAITAIADNNMMMTPIAPTTLSTPSVPHATTAAATTTSSVVASPYPLKTESSPSLSRATPPHLPPSNRSTSGGGGGSSRRRRSDAPGYSPVRVLKMRRVGSMCRAAWS